MKKNLFILAAALFGAMSVSAVEMPEKRHTLEITIGDPMPLNIIGPFYDCGCGPEEAMSKDYLTGDHHGLALPTFNINYHYAAKSWLEVGFTAGATARATRYYERAPIEGTPWETAQEVLYGHRIGYLMADLRFTYLRREVITLYSGVGLGLALDYFDQAHQPLGTRKMQALPMAHLSAFGMQVGRKVYWSLELGAGAKGFVNTGIGFRF